MGADDLPVGEGTEVLQRCPILYEGARDIRDAHTGQMPVKLGTGDVGSEILKLLADEEGIAGCVDAERCAGARGRAQRVVPRMVRISEGMVARGAEQRHRVGRLAAGVVIAVQNVAIEVLSRGIDRGY